MKLITAIVSVLLCTTFSTAQLPYNFNSWVIPSRTYYRFQVVKDGIYHIDHSALTAAGISVGTIDARKFQVFGRGQELFLYINDGGNNTIDPGEFIEFYAQRNDGWLDSNLYADKSWQVNPAYSLFNDTAAYYLTWNNDTAFNRRMVLENDTSFTGYIQSLYCYKESQVMFTGSYHGGSYYGSEYPIVDPDYTKAEGWFGSSYAPGIANVAVNTSNIYTGAGAPDAVAKAAAVGTNNQTHVLNITVANATFDTTFFNSDGMATFSRNVTAANLTSPTTTFSFNSTGSGSYIANSYCYIKYPHTFNFENQSQFWFYLSDDTTNGQLKSLCSITNFNTKGKLVLLYNLTANKRIAVAQSNLTALVPNFGGEKFCFMTSEKDIALVTGLQKVTFTDYKNVEKNYNYLIITNQTLLTEAYLYKTYRESKDGGSYTVVVADVDELYDQFAFGIKKHPLAIRAFADFALNNWDTTPRFLLLLGKSITNDVIRNNSANYMNCLVPSMGHKPSDLLFTVGLKGSSGKEPAIPTGRLAAKSGSEIIYYLNKVIEHESNKPAAWMKRGLHFGGGGGISEQYLFSLYLKNYQTLFEDVYFGGKIETFLKSTTAPIQMSISDQVRTLIDGGVTLMTFFGHASGSGWDQNIDDPGTYNNRGKYPFLITNACLTGDIHASGSVSSSEKFVLIPNLGVIGFWGSAAFGEQYELYKTTRAFYQKLSKDNYGDPVGKLIQQALLVSDVTHKITRMDMTLHGDPAVVLNSPVLPDITIAPEDIFFTPSQVTTAMDSFTVSMVVTNVGKATDSSFTVELTRTFQNGTLNKYSATVNGLKYKDTLTFKLPTDIVNGAGLNTFGAIADVYNFIGEYSETNNNASVIHLITSGEIVPVYPPEFAVVGNKSLTLKASTGNPIAAATNYIFELDTSYDFSSSKKQTKAINQSGGVVGWMPDSSIFTDSAVCFWRTSRQDTLRWRQSSFQYISGKSGWGQAHFRQFQNNTFNYIKHDTTDGRYKFIPTSKSLFCRNIGSPSPTQSKELATEFMIDGVNQGNGSCQGWSALHIAVIDSLSLKPWESDDYNFSQNNLPTCAPWKDYPENYFVFLTTSATGRINAVKMLNAVPAGNYVFAYTFNAGYFKSWEDSLFKAFQGMGSAMLITGNDTLGNCNPWIFFTKKGYPLTTIEASGNGCYDTIIVNATLNNTWYYGDITSPLIGPAKSWSSLHWRNDEVEKDDITQLKVSGVTNILKDSVIAGLNNLTTASGDTTGISAFINAGTYPWMKLNLLLRDDTLKTPAQPRKWQVLYDPAPEVAVNPFLFYSFNKDIMEEGEKISLTVACQNISNYGMDSLLITAWIIDASRQERGRIFERKRPLPAGDTLIINVEYSSIGLAGSNSLWLQINPNYDQLEQDPVVNNFLQVPFVVKRDLTNPVMDVTFDGVHILNGDIVSAKPAIVIQLTDENKFLALDSNNLFDVFLKKPGDVADVLIPYDGTTLIFIPASLPSNKARLEYKPDLTGRDGIYELAVQGKDKSGNDAGRNQYRISFNVINKPMVSEVLNWPNPFTTATHFVFTLTGSEVPQNFKIQILTITGKVVKEIFASELGTIRIGRNITTYTWDGTDQYGDRLANGVYLYRVAIKLNGNDMEKYSTEADKYFKKGYGKMYLMR